MFRRNLLPVVRTSPSDEQGLTLVHGEEREGMIHSGRAISPATGRTYDISRGYMDLLGRRMGHINAANLTNLLPGAGIGYEPLWRVRSLNILTGTAFSNRREVEKISRLVELERGGLYLDLGCSAGLYTRNLWQLLHGSGDVIGIDIAPGMLSEAARRARRAGAHPSFVRADAHVLPFPDATFDGVVCGGTLNELQNPPKALRECARVLKPGGRAAIMGILRATSERGQRLQELLSHSGLHFFAEEEPGDLLRDVGLRPEPPETLGSVFFVAAEN